MCPVSGHLLSKHLKRTSEVLFLNLSLYLTILSLIPRYYRLEVRTVQRTTGRGQFIIFLGSCCFSRNLNQCPCSQFTLSCLPVLPCLNKGVWTSIVVQCLRLCFQCRGVGLIPGQGTKIPHATWWGQKKKFKVFTHIISPLSVLSAPQAERSS